MSMSNYHYNGPARTLDHGQRIIRPATLSDSGFVYRLSMDPSVRMMSTRSDEFHFDQHDIWYREKLAHPEMHRMWIMEVDEIPVGQVRYGNSPDGAEIAISVSPTAQGKGYAQDLLNTTMPWAARDLGVSRFIALVLHGNQRSKFLFEHAGFRYIRDEERMSKAHWRYERNV